MRALNEHRQPAESEKVKDIEGLRDGVLFLADMHRYIGKKPKAAFLYASPSHSSLLFILTGMIRRRVQAYALSMCQSQRARIY